MPTIRGAVASWCATGLVAAGLIVSGGSSALAEDAAPWSVPSVPKQQPGLVMDCSPGQIDLNHATLTELQLLPDVSRPVAERIVAMRPHDRLEDLLVVPGIGADALAAIKASALACSTPLTVPPPADDACTSPDQIDLNDPVSLGDLSALFGRPTAQRIIAAQPFPDQAHALVTLAAGAGPGKVRKLADKLCLTPEPKTTGGINYSFVYAAAGGRADLDKFAIVIPPGTLTSPVGQWLKIAPQTTPTRELDGPEWPSAKFEVLGEPWSNGQKHVYVTMPTDPGLALFAGSAVPAIAHYAADDRSAGEVADSRVDSASGTITAAVTHLSLFDSISQGVAWVSEPLIGLLTDGRFPAPSCDGSWTMNSSTGSWTKGTAHVDLTGALLNLPGNTVPPFGWPQKHCVQSTSNGSYEATLRLVNNSRTFESLTRYSGEPTLGDANLVGADPLQLLITVAAQGVLNHPVAYPGAEVTVSVPSGDQAAVRMTPNVPLTAFWAIINETPIADLLDELGNDSPETNAIVKNGFGCALQMLDAQGSLDGSNYEKLDSMAGFLKTCIDYESIKVSILAAEHAGKIPASKVGALGVALNKLQRYALWLKVGRIGVSGYDSWFNYAGGSSAGIIDIENYAPKPTVDSMGRVVREACLRPSLWRWTIDDVCQDAYYSQIVNTPGGSGGKNGFPEGKIARDSQGHAWLIDNADSAMLPIADGGTYLCLAKHYAVDWDANLDAYRSARKGNGDPLYAISTSPATCDSSVADDRPINTGDTGDGSAIVLRQSDGTSWVIWNGQRQPISSGAEFECWVNPKFAANIEFDVWDQVTTAQLNKWPTMPEGNWVSNCGDPLNPTY